MGWAEGGMGIETYLLLLASNSILKEEDFSRLDEKQGYTLSARRSKKLVPVEGGQMFPANALVHDGVFPEVINESGLLLRKDVLGRDFNGRSSKRIAKRTSALTRKLQSVLTKFLEPGEELLYIARVQRHANILIQYTMFWHIYYASATVLVFTNRRLLHLRVKSNNRWRRGARACTWADIESAIVKGSLNRVLQLKFKSGSKYRYWRISRPDALNIKKLLPLLLKAGEGTPARSKALVSLCPDCKGELPVAAQKCPACGLRFKIKRTMYWLSLIPAAAYIYTRNWFLALIDLYAQTYGYILLVAATYTVLGATLGWHDAKGNTILMTDGVALLAAGVIIFGLDVLITIHHNNYFIEDFIPVREKVRPSEPADAFAAGGSIG
jgi:hypothetical protein